MSYIFAMASVSRLDSDLLARALAALGIDRLLLTVHDASFPGAPGEDLGRGSPYSDEAGRFLRFVRGLGFTGVQLGPQGKTSRVNPSPFDGTLFSRSPLSIALQPLTRPDRWRGILPAVVLRALADDRPAGADRKVAHDYIWRAQEIGLRCAFAHLSHRERELQAEQAAFTRDSASWLADDSRYQALSRRHDTDDWRAWPDEVPSEADAAEMSFNDFAQFVVHAQHDELRTRAADLGLKLYGDLQVGTSLRDLWSHRSVFLADYVMGAPPSRTNPEGQPWGYPVIDPRGYRGPGGTGDGGGLRFFRARLDKSFAEFDGLRIDHPHGLCCPWVYRDRDPDPLRAVQTGARLFSSPDLPEHPALAAFAIARPDQLDRSRPRYADDWERALTPEQVARYSVLFDALVAAGERHGRARIDIACEVLSTCPFPLAAVMARHRLGRFRVTQKADPLDPADPYRTADASPADWVMLGTHDTPPIWQVVDGWTGTTRVAAWASYLAVRLEPQPARRPAFAAALERDTGRLVGALFADLFVGPARQVSVFFPDLFGMKETYNRPGVVHPDNWSLRVPPDWEQAYAAGCARGQALDLRAALALALRARAGTGDGALAALADELERP